MIKQAAAAPRPCRAKPQLPHPSPFPGTLSGPVGCLFPQTCEKIALFRGFARRKFIRTSWRRCLTPGRAEFSRHADELPVCKSPETANF